MQGISLNIDLSILKCLLKDFRTSTPEQQLYFTLLFITISYSLKQGYVSLDIESPNISHVLNEVHLPQWLRMLDNTHTVAKLWIKKKQALTIEKLQIHWKKLPSFMVTTTNSSDKVDFKIDNVISTPIIWDHKSEKWFLQKYFYYTIKLKSLFKKRFDFFFRPQKEMSSLIEYKDKLISFFSKNSFSQNQKLAILSGILQNTLFLSGGPGTGKTYTSSSIVFLLLLFKKVELPFICLVAPTGKAADILFSVVYHNLVKWQNSIGTSFLLEQLEAGKTIHRLLQYEQEKGIFYYHSNNLLPYQVYLVDETSMLDLNLFTKFLMAVPPNTSLYFMGDPFQLSPVSSGDILSSIFLSIQNVSHFCELKTITTISKKKQRMLQETFSNILPTNIFSFENSNTSKQNNSLEDLLVFLQVTHRSNSDIVTLAQKYLYERLTFEVLQKQNLKTLTLYTHHNEWLQEWLNQTLFKKSIIDVKWDYVSLCNTLYLQNIDDIHSKENTVATLALLSYFYPCYFDNNISMIGKQDIKAIQNIRSSSILTLTHKGNFSREYFNERCLLLVRQKVHTLFLQAKNNQNKLQHGSPIIVTQNDYSNQLYNGDIGICLHDQAGHSYAIFYKNNILKYYPIHLLSSIDLAFSLTIHKSQGSEYDNIVVCLPSNEDIQNTHSELLLQKTIIYTAITRAKERLAICISPETWDIIQKQEKEVDSFFNDF